MERSKRYFSVVIPVAIIFRKINGGPSWAILLNVWLILTMFAQAQAQNAPVPLVNTPLVPVSIAPGAPAFTLTVNGTGFISGATANWNGIALATTFVNAEQLRASVPAVNVASAGTAAITVFNPAPGGECHDLA